MPTFSYKCPNCGCERDIFLKKAPASKDDSPACDLCDTLMDKQVTAPGSFQFKGGGYYETDFKHK